MFLATFAFHLISEARTIEKEFQQCETNGVSYAIRLKANNILFKNAKHLGVEIMEAMKNDITQYFFIVTNMDLKPEEILRYYRNRGTMENFIKESKSKVVNANRLQLHVLAYNLFNPYHAQNIPYMNGGSMKDAPVLACRYRLIKI